MTLDKRVYVDWDRDDSFTTTGDDISAYVKNVSWRIGVWDRYANVARAGRAVVTLNNADRVFSPFNASGAYYGRLTVNLPIRIDATDEISTWTVFRGVITDIDTANGDHGQREATITAEDGIGILSRAKVNLPRRTSLTSDAALKLITSAVFPAVRATGTITLDANISDGDTVTIGSVTYTFETGTLDVPYEVKAGATASASAMNLAAAINAAHTGTELGYGAATVYAANTLKHPDVTAKAEGLGGASGGTTAIEPTYAFNGVVGKYSLGTQQTAQSFMVDAGQLTELQYYIGAKIGSPGTVTWEILDSLGGEPGSVLLTGTFTPTENAWNVISVTDGISLYGDTLYWTSLRLTTIPPSEGYYQWYGGTDDPYTDGIGAYRWLSGGDGTTSWHLRADWDFSTRITTGTPAGANIYLTAVAHGAWGNAIALSDSGTHIAVSDATLTGGADGPTGLIDFEAGTCTLDEIGAGWKIDKTSGLAAAQDVIDSEGTALFFADSDGTLTYKNRDWVLTQNATADAVTLDGEFQRGATAIAMDDIINRVTLRYRPSTTLTSGVIAQATSTLSVPGTGKTVFGSGSQERHNPSDSFSNPDNTALVRLSYIDPGTGDITGAESLTLPLVAGTDYTVFENSDGTGFDYTYNNLVLFSAAALSSGVDITMQNSALGPLYIIGLKQRGTAIVAYDPVDVMREDSTSISTYGLREKTVSLPFTANNTEFFAPTYARYLVRRFATPKIYQDTLDFRNISEVGGVNLFGLGIGSIANISEPQTGISGRRAWITGVNGSIGMGGASMLQWFVRQLDDAIYGVWDDATYGQWDNCVWSL